MGSVHSQSKRLVCAHRLIYPGRASATSWYICANMALVTVPTNGGNEIQWNHPRGGNEAKRALPLQWRSSSYYYFVARNCYKDETPYEQDSEIQTNFRQLASAMALMNAHTMITGISQSSCERHHRSLVPGTCRTLPIDRPWRCAHRGSCRCGAWL